MPTVTINLENIPQGEMVEIPYLGYFENGVTTEVEQARWDRYVEYSGAAARFSEDSDSLEISTEQQREEAESARRLAELGGDTPEELEDEYKKSELVNMAESMGIETSSKNKDELAEEIAASQSGPQNPDSFTSVASELNENQEDE